MDERESYLAKELNKLPKNGIKYRVIDDHQLKSIIFDIEHNKQLFNIQLSIPLDYPNNSPKYKFGNSSGLFYFLLNINLSNYLFIFII